MVMTDNEAFYKQIADITDQIQAELVSYGYQGNPGETPVRVSSAFGVGSMSFTGWLWSVFLPSVKAMLRKEREFPAESSVGTQAIRELDAYPEAEKLVDLLCRLDYLINRQP
jgi:uncharacterized protein YqcC (DUF446 family)